MPDGASKTVGMPTIAAANSINTLHNPSVLIIGAGIGGITLALDLDEKRLTNWIVRIFVVCARAHPPRSSTARTTLAGRGTSTATRERYNLET